jgi:hypothetical protein
MEYKEKVVAFVDVLGFKTLVESSENGTGKTLSELMGLVKHLGSSEDVNRIRTRGPSLCPLSPFVQRDLDFQLTQITDCVVVSAEVSPVGALSVIDHCWGAVITLLLKGLMCRGYITQGKVHHTESQLIGPGYQKAYAKESEVSAFRRAADERGTPFVEIDPILCKYIDETNDGCVKEMFSRMVKTNEDTTVLYPFKRIGHSFILMGPGIEFNPEREKKAVQNVREGIHMMKEKLMLHVDRSNTRAIQKVEHYIHALDLQLEACDRTDYLIEKFR